MKGSSSGMNVFYFNSSNGQPDQEVTLTNPGDIRYYDTNGVEITFPWNQWIVPQGMPSIASGGTGILQPAVFQVPDDEEDEEIAHSPERPYTIRLVRMKADGDFKLIITQGGDEIVEITGEHAIRQFFGQMDTMMVAMEEELDD